MDFTFNAPLNRVSFGQVTLSLLREIFKRKDINSFRLFPISNIDLQSFLIDEEFKANLEKLSSSDCRLQLVCMKLE